MVLELVDSQVVSASVGRRVACIQILGSLLPDLCSAAFRADIPHRLTVSDLKQPWRNDNSGWPPHCRESGAPWGDTYMHVVRLRCTKRWSQIVLT